MRWCQAALPVMSRSNVSNVTKRFPRIAKTNANLAINVSTHNANWGQEGWCCTQGQEVIKLIAPTKRINCTHQRADKVTLTLGGCDSL